MAKFKPVLTQEEFEGLHKEADRTRGKFVRVSKQALEHLLSDHSQLWAITGEEDDE